MSIGIDPEGLFAIYADWIAFLREKHTTLEGQLAKLQRKDAHHTDAPKPYTPTKPEEIKAKSPNASPVLAGTSAGKNAEPENGFSQNSKEEGIPDWLWQTEEPTSSSLLDEENEMDSWM